MTTKTIGTRSRRTAAKATAKPAEVARAEPIKKLDPKKGIQSVQDLADHLHAAAQVELSTIPLYLYGAYSIRTRGHSQWAAPRGVLRSLIGISIEEMLHLALVRNLMVAIGCGDQITFYDKKFIPSYPSKMLHRYNPDDKDGAEIDLSLGRLSFEQVKTFRRIEMPDDVSSKATTFDAHPKAVDQYTSLGAFYRSIEKGFCDLDEKKKIKWALGDARKQYKRAFWNEFGNGKPIRVHDLKTAKAALNLIIEQGEGTRKDHQHLKVKHGVEDFTHYEKFLRIERGEEGIGAVDGADHDIRLDNPEATWPVLSDPKVADFTDQPDVHSLMTLFNAAYCYTLCVLDELYKTSTDDVETVRIQEDRHELFSRRYGLERNGVAIMQGVLYPIAQVLVSTPIPGGKEEGMLHAAPSFEFFDFSKAKNRTKKQQLIDLCDKAIDHYPVLGGPDGVQRQISLLAEV
ncbi:ferritin-like protein [Actinomadura sp. 3N508]|uniref:ferritin-like protein n=1 Tax=Actinomadura sp. 3N508 TaxID=3375153 RepID=UPI00378CAD8D